MQEGAVYPCTVQSIRDYGAMVKLDSGQEMLLHISELADHRVGPAIHAMPVSLVYMSLTIHQPAPESFGAACNPARKIGPTPVASGRI